MGGKQSAEKQDSMRAKNKIPTVSLIYNRSITFVRLQLPVVVAATIQPRHCGPNTNGVKLREPKECHGIEWPHDLPLLREIERMVQPLPVLTPFTDDNCFTSYSANGGYRVLLGQWNRVAAISVLFYPALCLTVLTVLGSNKLESFPECVPAPIGIGRSEEPGVRTEGAT